MSFLEYGGSIWYMATSGDKRTNQAHVKRQTSPNMHALSCSGWSLLQCWQLPAIPGQCGSPGKVVITAGNGCWEQQAWQVLEVCMLLYQATGAALLMVVFYGKELGGELEMPA